MAAHRRMADPHIDRIHHRRAWTEAELRTDLERRLGPLCRHMEPPTFAAFIDRAVRLELKYRKDSLREIWHRYPSS